MRLARARERQQESVAEAFDLETVVGRELLSNDRIVSLDQLVRFAVAEPFRHRGEALDVTEENRHRPVGRRM